MLFLLSSNFLLRQGRKERGKERERKRTEKRMGGRREREKFSKLSHLEISLSSHPGLILFQNSFCRIVLVF